MRTPLVVALNKADAAQAVGLSEQAIERAIKSGALRAKRSGRTPDGLPAGRYLIEPTELKAWYDSLDDA